MKRNIAVALSLAVGTFAITQAAIAQRTPIVNPPTTTTTTATAPTVTSSAADDAFKNAIARQKLEVGWFLTGFQFSLDSGKTYQQNVSYGGTLPSSICPSGGSTSLCATGTKPWMIYVRFPNISTAADLADVFAKLGLGYGGFSTVNHFAVLRVDNLSTNGKTCDNALIVESSPFVVDVGWPPKPGSPTLALPISLAEPWTTAPTSSDPAITCVWNVVAGVYDGIIKRGPLHVISSNQIRLDIGRRP